MPIARFQMPDGRIAKFEVPEGTSPQQAEALISQQLFGKTPEPPVEKAGFSVGDTARAAQQGLYGGLQSLDRKSVV